jgi:hypothetical protein
MFRFFLPAALFFMIVFIVLSVAAQPQSNTIKQRHFNKTALQKYKADGDFNYQTEPPQQNNILSIVLHYLGKLLHKLLGTEGEITTAKIVFYGLMIGALIMIVLNLIGIDMGFLFGRKANTIVPYQVSGENIKEMNLDELILQAAENKEWKLCVRYQYLKALKQLSDKELIRWKLGKTNMEYYYELDETKLKIPFLNITDLFETAWYGSRDIDASEYQSTNIQFEKFYETISATQA